MKEGKERVGKEGEEKERELKEQVYLIVSFLW